MNTKILLKNYTLNYHSYQLKIPFDLEPVIPANDRVRLLCRFVDELDLTELYATYSRIRIDAASPCTMLKLILYAYLEGIYSSRGMEKACYRDINFMYILEGKPVPDHTTFARFRTTHLSACASTLMAQVTDMLKALGELSGREIFIDGTKIEANANKYTFVWKRTVTKNFQRLMDRAAALYQECVFTYGLKPRPDGKVNLRHLKKLRRKLYEKKRERHLVFVHGSGKRKDPLQKHIELLESYINKFKEYIDKLHKCGTRNSYSKTDEDATFMRMKEDAMLNGQLKPAYNLQAGVDSGYVAWLTLSSRPTDTLTLIPFLNDMHSHIGFRYGTVVADAGYESEENYSYLEQENIRAMIKPSNYEISKTRKFRKDISRRENMPYNADGDFYTCMAGNRLYANRIRYQKTASGYRRQITIYRCHCCKDCKYKSECIKGRNWKKPESERYKKLNVSRKFERQRKHSLENITSEEGCRLRMNRSIYAEGFFAVLKEDRNFRRFLTRGRGNVYTECVLMAISHNIAQLDRKIQSGRLHTHLYELKTS